MHVILGCVFGQNIHKCREGFWMIDISFHLMKWKLITILSIFYNLSATWCQTVILKINFILYNWLLQRICDQKAEVANYAIKICENKLAMMRYEIFSFKASSHCFLVRFTCIDIYICMITLRLKLTFKFNLLHCSLYASSLSEFPN